ncbi:MAG: amino acid permease [Erythrobacter sp.]|jgi:APA family basic amino acid/polyamine antiporter|uniref:Amino acid permease n=1 Tax=Qipengyuania pacifica TaxID=2860199 RepID=A0ABS7JD27_9SPHN|nr:amino acid permease [Qipengyuania aerophila]MAQ67296.1 amino acid permease [Sphingomonadaceae bacterium]MBL4895514.1 amino acid permease [Erythrobacter sp.]MBX7487936.1 amino acid permease [Qipengyuania aerophila]MCH2496797.1 amino acid permease [Erythrobacter sp.]HAD16022.1 amino acid permease [Erythrobacter sp.]
MIFDRVKPLDAILAAAEKKSLSRSLGWFQLTLMGIGCVIGTGIFVLTAVGAQKAGPGLMIAFAIAGGVCIVAALCYAEIAAMIPVAGSAYTYSYATIGEFFAWTVGWALIMEYAIAASAVSVGWSGYFSGTVLGGLGIHLPAWLSAGPLALGGAAGGFINLPALVIALLVTGLLVIGTSESAKVNAVLVIVKVTALTAFVAITLTSSEFEASHFNPFLPAGVFGGWGTGVGAVGAAATMFFAYVGFDAVSTAAEETKNPQRNVPIGLVGSLLFCTIFYILVAAGAIGTIGGQPIMDAMGIPLEAGSPELARQCAMPQYADALVCSNEPLAHVLKMLGFSGFGNAIGLAAFLALPSVILVLIFGQTRIFFVMSRDGLLPERLSRVHPRFKTPHVVTIITGLAVAIGAAFFPVGQLADISNAGTLYAFLMVAVAVMVLRVRDPGRKRHFKVPMVWVVAPLTIIGCVLLFFNLPSAAMLFLPGWGIIGVVIYVLYSRRRSHLGQGIVEVVDDVAGDETMVPIEPGRKND